LGLQVAFFLFLFFFRYDLKFLPIFQTLNWSLSLTCHCFASVFQSTLKILLKSPRWICLTVDFSLCLTKSVFLHSSRFLHFPSSLLCSKPCSLLYQCHWAWLKQKQPWFWQHLSYCHFDQRNKSLQSLKLTSFLSSSVFGFKWIVDSQNVDSLESCLAQLVPSLWFKPWCGTSLKATSHFKPFSQWFFSIHFWTPQLNSFSSFLLVN